MGKSSSWRPKDWINPYLVALVVDRERFVFRLPDDGIFIEGKGKELGTNAFEAGADAMLEVVRGKLGKFSFLLDEEAKDGE